MFQIMNIQFKLSIFKTMKKKNSTCLFNQIFPESQETKKETLSSCSNFWNTKKKYYFYSIFL